MSLLIRREVTQVEVVDILRENGVLENAFINNGDINIKIKNEDRVYNLGSWGDQSDLMERIRINSNNDIIFF